MSVSRFTVAERVDNYARRYFSGYTPDGDLPQPVATEEDEPSRPKHEPPPERPSWYRGRDRANPNQDFR